MKYLSLFTGIGGFELGIVDKAECIGFSEIDKYAAKVYQHHFPTHHNYGDITKINAEELPDFDLLVGGFPCQSFSIAGKRKGFDDTRGTLFFDIARILRAKQPRLFLLENVKGLLSHDNGNTFRAIISTLDELGYDLQWQVLNSKNYGVPQNRERIFIIGHLRGTRRPEVFPFGGQSNENTTIGKSTETTVARTLTGGGHSGGNHSGMTILQLNSPTHSNDRVYGEDGISPTLNTMQGGNRQPFIQQTARGKNKGGEHEISPTLTKNSFEHNNHLVEDMKIRRLTPTECERLQGFPEIEKYAILQLCKDIQNNSVSVEVLNPKLQKPAGNAERKESPQSVSSAQSNLRTNYQQENKLVQTSVLIDCVENGVEILSQGKSLLNAKNAEKKNWSHQYIRIEDFVQMLVGINTIKERIISHGEEESHPNEQSLTPQKSGLKLGKLYGNEIMLPVEDAENDLITLKKLLKSTTSNLSDTESLEQRLLILSSFVIRAISGYIPKEILNQNTFTIGIKTKIGWTAVENTSDSQRYKMCGNAVTVNVIRDIIKKLTCPKNYNS